MFDVKSAELRFVGSNRSLFGSHADMDSPATGRRVFPCQTEMFSERTENRCCQ